MSNLLSLCWCCYCCKSVFFNLYSFVLIVPEWSSGSYQSWIKRSIRSWGTLCAFFILFYFQNFTRLITVIFRTDLQKILQQKKKRNWFKIRKWHKNLTCSKSRKEIVKKNKKDICNIKYMCLFLFISSF